MARPHASRNARTHGHEWARPRPRPRDHDAPADEHGPGSGTRRPAPPRGVHGAARRGRPAAQDGHRAGGRVLRARARRRARRRQRRAPGRRAAPADGRPGARGEPVRDAPGGAPADAALHVRAASRRAGGGDLQRGARAGDDGRSSSSRAIEALQGRAPPQRGHHARRGDDGARRQRPERLAPPRRHRPAPTRTRTTRTTRTTARVVGRSRSRTRGARSCRSPRRGPRPRPRQPRARAPEGARARAEPARRVAPPAGGRARGHRGPRGGARHPVRRGPQRPTPSRASSWRRSSSSGRCGSCATRRWSCSSRRPAHLPVAAIREIDPRLPGGGQPSTICTCGRSAPGTTPSRCTCARLDGPGPRPAPLRADPKHARASST